VSSGRDQLLVAAVEYFAAHGIGDVSLRTIAGELGTSHRMLIYHFGSRDGLLAEVVRAVEAEQRATLADLAADPGLPLDERGRRFWRQVADAAQVYGALFFELSAHALQDRPYTGKLRADLITPWLEPMTDLLVEAGIPPADAPSYARLGLAAARGLVLDLLATGDRDAVDRTIDLLNRIYLTATH
jgi:AcrR family transcriptional regulator